MICALGAAFAIRSARSMPANVTTPASAGSDVRGNKANIQHHYDVSNAFYRLWLDERMVYSCAYFRSETDSLDQAQLQKLREAVNADRKLGRDDGGRIVGRKVLGQQQFHRNADAIAAPPNIPTVGLAAC